MNSVGTYSDFLPKNRTEKYDGLSHNYVFFPKHNFHNSCYMTHMYISTSIRIQSQFLSFVKKSILYDRITVSQKHFVSKLKF